MKEIKRDVYMDKLISRKENGLIKVITGIRRCGKSYLLDPMFKNYLISIGIKDNHIIKIDLDERKNNKYLYTNFKKISYKKCLHFWIICKR